VVIEVLAAVLSEMPAGSRWETFVISKMIELAISGMARVNNSRMSN
jgi:hypothetical protein